MYTHMSIAITFAVHMYITSLLPRFYNVHCVTLLSDYYQSVFNQSGR